MFVVDRPFMAILPKPPEIGDEVIIKGKLKDDANMYVYIPTQKVYIIFYNFA